MDENAEIAKEANTTAEETTKKKTAAKKTKMELKEKLLEIQLNLKANKNLYNNFGKYSYRSCESILEALKPLFKVYKVAVILNDEIIFVGERYYIKATAKLVDIESNDTIEVTAFAREEENKKGMDGSQITGASSSYARKYALNGLFAIDDNKDSDYTNTGETETKLKNTNTGETETKPKNTKTQSKPNTVPIKISAREKVISILSERNMDINAYGKKHGLTKDTKPEVYEKLLAELLV